MGLLLETRGLAQLSIFTVVLVFCLCFTSIDAYDALDPNGNITIKWDVIQWNADGYDNLADSSIFSFNLHVYIGYRRKDFFWNEPDAVATIFNYQKYRHIEQPGWKLSWTWAKKEVIWDMIGGQATEQGDCSRFKGNIPHSCKRTPTIVDMMPGTPYNKQVANCCKGGVLSSWVQDPANSASSFQLSVGQAGTTNKTVRLPKNFTLQTPGPGYTCGQAKIVKPTTFLSPDKRRSTQALMTWNITCTYSQFLAQKTPACCVSLSSFYSEQIVDCPTCSCGCRSLTQPASCVDSNSPQIASAIARSDTNNLTRVQCTNHMCPVRVHWHIKLNYKAYWRAKVTITNFNYARNYTQWNLVAQHPNFNDLETIFSFNFEPLIPYGSINDTAMFWGVKFYNDLLMQNGPSGNVQSELLFKKDKATFTFDKGWAFPRRIYFNGDNCVMPPPDAYPFLPNEGASAAISMLQVMVAIATSLVILFAHPQLA